MADVGVIIERLNESHDLSGFDCGNPQLNDWLKRFAWSNDRAGSARTFVAHRSGRVVGYHSLAAGSVLKHEAPARVAKGLANHPVGVALLARLAVDRADQGKGLGRDLLRDALARVAQAAELVGIRAVLVHAVDDGARRFYLRHGSVESPINPLQLMMLMKDLRASI